MFTIDLRKIYEKIFCAKSYFSTEKNIKLNLFKNDNKKKILSWSVKLKNLKS